jgi:hydrogenase maturation factor
MLIGVPGTVLEITADGKAQVLLAGAARQADTTFIHAPGPGEHQAVGAGGSTTA